MSEDTQKALSRAVYKMLRPLARLLLRHGVSYRLFSELARNAYVDAAMEDFAIPGRKPSFSRVAVLTGINRKDIAKLKDRPHPLSEGGASARSPGARLIDTWINESRFQDAAGKPSTLPMDGHESSFAALVDASCSDVPVRAALDELVRIRAVEVGPQGVQLLSPGYIPFADVDEQVRICGTAVGDLLTTLDYNLSGSANGKQLQRTVSYDNIPVELLERIRSRGREEGEAFLLQVNEWLAACDRDTNKELAGSGRVRAGLGIYYFEHIQDDEAGSSDPGASESIDEN